MTLFKKYYTCNTIKNGEKTGSLIIQVNFWVTAKSAYNQMGDFVKHQNEAICDFRRIG